MTIQTQLDIGIDVAVRGMTIHGSIVELRVNMIGEQRYVVRWSTADGRIFEWLFLPRELEPIITPLPEPAP